MTHTHVQTNGASLEDCHANFFALTDVCGIKWIVYREAENPATLEAGQDAVLQSYGRCLEAELLAVWRRVPRRALVASDQFGFGSSGASKKAAGADVHEKNLLSHRKELWIFWYGDKPEQQFQKLVSSKLKEVPDISGTWENVLLYEARTLLYKALNNLIERSLLRKGFVRLGKWFVQPFDGPERPLQKSSHLSFSFQYFMHGESCVCASVDVRQHPAVRRLSMHHIQVARSQSSSVKVILAPFGMAGTLTGVTYKSGAQTQLLTDWNLFYPLDKNKYYSQDGFGDVIAMPAAVEVMVCGVRLVYPTCYVLTTDLDSSPEDPATTKSKHTSGNPEDSHLMGLDIFHVEPSPFSTSNHSYLAENSPAKTPGDPICLQNEVVWQEELAVNPEETTEQLQARLSNISLESSLKQWDYGNPGRIVGKRKLRKRNSNNRSRFSSKIPFHKKSSTVDDLGWPEMITPTPQPPAPPPPPPAPSGISNPPSNRLPAVPSPASVGGTPAALTPRPVPNQLLSPMAPPTPGPNTPKSVGPPSCPPYSPFTKPKPASIASVAATAGNAGMKRPMLPCREYEAELVRESNALSDSIYDSGAMQQWLNHPVKKFRGSNVVNGGQDQPLRPFYRRKSQNDLYEPRPNMKTDIEDHHPAAAAVDDAVEFSDVKRGPEKAEGGEDLFTIEGLKPSFSDLDNLFEDSNSDNEEPMHPDSTPPGSNKPDEASTVVQKLKKIDPTGNLPHDQLAKMFPTPPSHEHNPVASPADPEERQDPPSPGISGDVAELNGNLHDDFKLMLASEKFAPLTKLYSDDFPAITVPYHVVTFNKNFAEIRKNSRVAGMSPISPLVNSPAAASRGGQAGNPGAGPASAAATAASAQVKPKMAEASSLVLNLVLSDSLLNVFRDHNFDSCTMCVCSNEGNTRGRDAAKYLPKYSGEDDCPNCECGFSAVINRKLSHMSGLFYEDEAEVTSITEDMYGRKKNSLLMISNPGMAEVDLLEKSAVVDKVPMQLFEVIRQQFVYNLSSQSSLRKCSDQYLKHVRAIHSKSNSRVEHMDNNYFIYITLEQVKNQTDSSTKLDDDQKANCVHEWTLLNAPGPHCSEDILRVMKSLQPVLNSSLHVRKSVATKDVSLSVQGPLTWRQFHRMAGTATKGNTDDQCEPLPVPNLTAGHDKDFVTLSPLALHFWESLSLEPFSLPRDVAYIVVSPESEFILNQVKTFFKTLSGSYEQCRLGRHVPISKILRDGILQVGKKRAENLAQMDHDQNNDRWFEMLGDSHIATLLRLYSQVCRHYLVPLLHSLQVDKSLVETSNSSSQKSPSHQGHQQHNHPHSPMPPPMSNYSLVQSHDSSTGGDFARLYDDSGVNGSESGGVSSSTQEDEGTPPAVVIYMVDPFSFGSESPDAMRLSNLGLLRCYSQMLPQLGNKAQLRDNIFLQVISLESVLEITQTKHQAKMPNVMRGLSFSVYSQVQRTLQYQKECKTLTGFGPGSSIERFLKNSIEKRSLVRELHCPAYVLAQTASKKKSLSDTEVGPVGSGDRNSVLFCNYFLSEDQHWLLASCCDDRGELVKTVVINIEIPNKTRRKKASARRVGLRKLMDWILGVMTMSLSTWRLVIGRIGRIGHGELRGWSVLLSRKALRKASKQLKESCPWQSDVPSILSACLVSMEPDANLRLFPDQFTPDERFGQTASHCQLSTPRDASATHILVFPTSAKAQSSQKAFEDHQDGIANNDLGLEFDLGIDGIDGIDQNEDIGDIGDIFNDWNPGGTGIPGSPGSPKQTSSQPGSPTGVGGRMSGESIDFKYGQEEVGDRIEILQQPLALGYLVSTATTGPMPRWFWSSCPHLEDVCPVFLKAALHINVASIQHGGDDGFGTSGSSSGRLHSLDSTYTADVLRYVLEGYNRLSWLSVDSATRDRKSCLPLHVQLLQQMYNGLASLV